MRPAHTITDRDDSRTRCAWIVLVALLVFAAMLGPFALGRVYTADDLGAFHLPLRAFYSTVLERGQAFDWMPGLFGGYYFTGEGQVGPYHPVHWLLYRVLPLAAAFDVECLLSYPLLFVGTCLLLARWLKRDAALLGALAFTFSGFNFLHFVHPNAVAVVAHIPWLLWAIDVVLRGENGRKLLFAKLTLAGGIASQLLLGYPQYVWFSALACVGYAVWLQTHNVQCTMHSDGRRRRLATVVWFAFLGVLIGCVQLLPTADALAHSSRQAADATFAESGSLHPLNVVQLVAPYLFATRVAGQNTHELGLYAGAVPLVLCVWLLTNRQNWGQRRPLILAALALGAAALLLALGSHGLIYRLQTYLPLVGNFRFPCRAMVLVHLAVAALAAIGFERLLTASTENKTTKRLWVLVGVSVALAALGPLLWPNFVAVWPLVWAGPLLIAVAALLTAFAARGHRLAPIALIVLAAADLGAYGLSYAVWPHTMPLDEFVGSPLGEARVALDLADPKTRGGRQGDRILLAGLERIDGYAGLLPQRQLDYANLAALRVAGVRAVLRTEANEQIPGLERQDDQWLRVPEPLPWARLVTRTAASRDPATDLGQIPVETTALIENPLDRPLADTSSTPGVLTITARTPGLLKFQADCPGRQLLVVAESFHEGWQANIDGQAAQAFRSNGDFLGCLVEPGVHNVTLSFHPASLAHGHWLSVFGLGLVGVTLLVGRRKRDRRATPRTESTTMTELISTEPVVADRPPLSETCVSFVLPVYNESAALQTLFDRIITAVADCGVRCEVLFVNDGSTDGTAEVLDRLAAKFRQVRVIHLSRNFGHQAAVQAGLTFASGHCVLLMDSDMQDAPEALSRFLEKWQAGFDVVYAIRTDRQESPPKRFLFTAFYRVLRAIATTRIPPDAGNFGLIDARVLREIVSLAERDRYLPGLRSWVGYRQTGITVPRGARYDNHPRVSLRGLWQLAKTAVFSFSSFPLTVFYLIGYSALAIFVGLSGYSLYCKLFTDLAIPGWTSHILSASFFGALNALGISMLGEYVIRIYDQVRNRPLYLIDRKVNFERKRSGNVAAQENKEKSTTKTRRARSGKR